MKKLISIVLAVILCMGITGNVFAAETADIQEEKVISVTGGNAKVLYQDSEKALVEVTVQPRDNNYGNAWVNGSGSGSFTVNCTHSGTIGVTFKVESEDDGAFAYCSLRKPNGDLYWNSAYVIVNVTVLLNKVHKAQ